MITSQPIPTVAPVEIQDLGAINSKWHEYETDELGDIYSDYYKDVHGFRPRNISADDRNGLIAGLIQLDCYMFNMRSTPAGRAQLKSEGWVV
jgi:hypothetical protein